MLWCFLFCKEDVTLLQGALKKLLTSHVIMSFFIREVQNTNIKKQYACVYHLLRSIARSLLFRLHILRACFDKKKNFNIVLILNANFLYY